MATKVQLAQYCADHFPVHNIGTTYMTAFYICVASLVFGAVAGYLFGKLGLSGIKADIAVIKAKIEPTPVPVAVVAPVVAV